MALILLLGPTASGKSALAMATAARLPVEIVSVDSAQVYRGLDIGTAKPGAADRQQVPHHLLDLIDARDSYSAARFVADARAAVTAIRGRGRLPLLVGGTMLYAQALARGLDRLPAADPALRARLEVEARELGWPALHARLALVDPVTAARLAPRDAQRIQRALEVHALSGRPLSALIGSSDPGRAATSASAATATTAATAATATTTTADDTGGPSAPEAVRIIALEPPDRARLHERIALRFDQMLAAGFVDEVAALRARGDLHEALPAIRCVGYRQIWAHLEGRVDPAQMREQGIAATRQLAKRQLTWLRSMPDRIRIDPEAPDALDRVLTVIEEVTDAGHIP